MQELSHGELIRVGNILEYKNLSKGDIAMAPDEWKYAPVLVSTNTERLGISRFKAQMWARENSTYVFRWPNRIRSHVNKPDVGSMEKLKEENAFFWQFFVPGVQAYLNNNVNPDVALVNGSPLITHSLTFETPDKYNKILKHIEDVG